MVALPTYMNNEYIVPDSLPASLCEIGPDADVFYSMHNPRFPNTATTTIIADMDIIIGHWDAIFPLIFNCRQQNYNVDLATLDLIQCKQHSEYQTMIHIYIMYLFVHVMHRAGNNQQSTDSQTGVGAPTRHGERTRENTRQRSQKSWLWTSGGLNWILGKNT